jgi:hypothetical protein
MSNQISDTERALVALFEGLTRMQRMALLARLEVAAGGLYRALAADEHNLAAREKLLAAAGDEEKNGALLRLMSTPKDRCEKCERALTQPTDGLACSFNAPSATRAPMHSNRSTPTAAVHSNPAQRCKPAPEITLAQRSSCHVE